MSSSSRRLSVVSDSDSLTESDVEVGNEFEVDFLVSRRLVRKKLQYLVKWRGYSKDENTWEPEENIPLELREAFDRQVANGDRDSKSGQLIDFAKTKKEEIELAVAAESNQPQPQPQTRKSKSATPKKEKSRAARETVTVEADEETEDFTPAPAASATAPAAPATPFKFSAASKPPDIVDLTESKESPRRVKSAAVKKEESSAAPPQRKSSRPIKRPNESKSPEIRAAETPKSQPNKPKRAKKEVKEPIDYEVEEISDSDCGPAYTVEKVRGRRFDSSKCSPGQGIRKAEDGESDDLDMGVSGYQYYFKWEGYDEAESTWEPSELTACEDKIKEFHVKAAKRLAAEANTLTQFARSETETPTLNKLVRRVYELGICSVQNALREKDVEECYNAVINTFNIIIWNIRARNLEDVLENTGFIEFKLRQPGRYDMTINSRHLHALVDPEAPWMPVIRSVLGEDAELFHSGCMLSMPGSHVQEYHADGPHLVKTCHTSPHCLVVFLPLVDLTSKNGAPEFIPTSHVQFDFDSEADPWKTECKAGSAIIFDNRIKHRGMPNNSDAVRPMIYLEYAKPYWRDTANNSMDRYKSLPSLLSVESREERLQKRNATETPGEKANETITANSNSAKEKLLIDTVGVSGGRERELRAATTRSEQGSEIEEKTGNESQQLQKNESATTTATSSSSVAAAESESVSAPESALFTPPPALESLESTQFSSANLNSSSTSLLSDTPNIVSSSSMVIDSQE